MGDRLTLHNTCEFYDGYTVQHNRAFSGFLSLKCRRNWTCVGKKQLANVLAVSISRLLLPVDCCCQYVPSPTIFDIRDVHISYNIEKHMCKQRRISGHLRNTIFQRLAITFTAILYGTLLLPT